MKSLAIFRPLAALAIPFIDREVPAKRVGKAVSAAGIAAIFGFVFFTVWGWLT